MSVYDQYLTVVRAVEEAILDWARPQGWIGSPLAKYPLGRLEDAFILALCYIVFVFVGMTVMPFRPSVKGLYPLKFFYNVVQVALCSYMFIEAGIQAYKHNYTIIPCLNFDQANPVMGPVLYIFYLSKILDFLDTVFIILEKRWKQLSFLHVYHHFSVFLIYWLNINVVYDGDVYLTIVLNGLIHMIMYTYYFVSLHTKEIPWKSALTMSQMIQFVLMNTQAIYLMATGCTSYPRRIILLYFGYILSLLLLFAQFYVVTYIYNGMVSKGKKSGKGEKKDK